MSFAVLRSPEEWKTRFAADPRAAVIAIGNFDGVHLGHQEILHRVVERARRENGIATAVTFDPHPLKILRRNDAPQLLYTIEQRLAEIERAGMDAALVLRFDEALARLSPREFIEQIVAETLRASAALVGGDFRFGYRGAGHVAMLRELGNEFRFDVECIEPVVCRGQVVSSTAIRQAVAEGRLTDAGRMLGRPFSLAGEIEAGAGVGRRVVVPTLNLRTHQEAKPKMGVYATEICVAGRDFRGVTNVGTRPTFDGQGLSVESFLFDFDGDVAGGKLEVRFWERLRDEMKFAGPEALKEQIAVDVARAKEFFRLLDRVGSRKQNA